MSTKKFLIITGIILLPAIILLGYSQFRTVKATNTESINYTETFLTHLNGGQQVPAIETDAHGQYEIKARADGSMLDYTLTLENIENVTGAHLHCGVPEENGPVVVPLMFDQAERDFANGSVSGSISMDDITEAGMQCQPNIDTLPHLMQAIRENKIYVNVHTTQYPDGEIRGQVVGGDMQASDGTSALKATSTPATSTPATSADTKEKSVDNTNSTNSQNSSQKITRGTSGEYVEDPNDPGCGYKDGIKYCQYLKRQRLLSEQGKTNVGFPDAGGKVNTTNGDVTGVYNVYVAPSSYHVMEGGRVSFSGSQFYPGESVTISRDGTTIGTVKADDIGKFKTVGYVMPYDAGTKEFIFRGEVSKISFPVEVMIDGGNPWLTLSSYYAGDTAPITIEGHGFGSNEEVKITFAGMNMGTVRANQSGEFSLDTMVPEGTAGSKTIQAEGLISGQKVTERFSQAF